ncbi:MAG: hypothetical protein U0M06_10955 [Clostridia bacterium]|nr:hypothetical protein [Clostridia bacterium]
MMNPMQMFQMLRGAQNPQQMFQNMLMQNPQMSSALSQIQNSTQGANPKDVAMQLARQRGMSEQEVMNMFNSLNRK